MTTTWGVTIFEFCRDDNCGTAESIEVLLDATILGEAFANTGDKFRPGTLDTATGLENVMLLAGIGVGSI